jgi:hypothetical protein
MGWAKSFSKRFLEGLKLYAKIQRRKSSLNYLSPREVLSKIYLDFSDIRMNLSQKDFIQ